MVGGAKDAATGALQGAAAFIDGIIPFGNPLENRLHLYDSTKYGLSYSQGIGEVTRDAEMTLAGGGLIARTKMFANSSWLGRNSSWFGRQAGAVLNKNDYVRIGWSWKGTRTAGREVFRIATGGPLPKSFPQWLQKSWQWMRHFDVN